MAINVEVNAVQYRYNESECVICKKGEEIGGDKLIKLRSDGKKTLARFSGLHGHNDLTQYLSTDPPVVAHKSCQRSFTQERNVPKTGSDKSDDSGKQQLRSVANKFDYKLSCFLCCQPVIDRYREVQTSVVHQTMLNVCKNRFDDWGFEVLGRLQTCGDLRAADARYHIKCHLNFSSGRPCPTLTTARLSGRPVKCEMKDLFEEVCEWMEGSDDELFTLD
jgi:hypothetical protein